MTWRLTRRWGVVAGLVLVVASNAVVLAGAAWNRSGTPDATLVLTQREAILPWRRFADDTGLSLRLNLGGDDQWWEGEATPWLGQEKLAELGFDVSVAADDRHASQFYRGMLPRTVFVALEYDGQAWLDWLGAQEKRPDEERHTDSHLFAVDAAQAAATLRQRYPDRSRYAVVRAVARLHHRAKHKEKPARLFGHIERLLVASVHVPLALRSELDAAAEEKQAERRYTATIAFGRRHEPWLVTTQRSAAAP